MQQLAFTILPRMPISWSKIRFLCWKKKKRQFFSTFFFQFLTSKIFFQKIKSIMPIWLITVHVADCIYVLHRSPRLIFLSITIFGIFKKIKFLQNLNFRFSIQIYTLKFDSINVNSNLYIYLHMFETLIHPFLFTFWIIWLLFFHKFNKKFVLVQNTKFEPFFRSLFINSFVFSTPFHIFPPKSELPLVLLHFTLISIPHPPGQSFLSPLFVV